MYLCVHAHIRAHEERVCVCLCACIVNFQLSSECRKAMSERMRVLGCQKKYLSFKLHGVLF